MGGELKNRKTNEDRPGLSEGARMPTNAWEKGGEEKILRCVIGAISLSECSHDLQEMISRQSSSARKEVSTIEANWLRDLNYNSDVSLFQSRVLPIRLSANDLASEERGMKSFPSKSIKWKSLPSSFSLLCLVCFPWSSFALLSVFSQASNAFGKVLSHRTPPEAIHFRTHSIAVHFNPQHQYSWLANKRRTIKDDEICVRKQPMGGKRNASRTQGRYID